MSVGEPGPATPKGFGKGSNRLGRHFEFLLEVCLEVPRNIRERKNVALAANFCNGGLKPTFPCIEIRSQRLTQKNRKCFRLGIFKRPIGFSFAKRVCVGATVEVTL